MAVVGTVGTTVVTTDIMAATMAGAMVDIRVTTIAVDTTGAAVVVATTTAVEAVADTTKPATI